MKPGATIKPGGVDRALGGDVGVSFADESDAIADDADVGVNPRIAAAIDHPSIANESVVLLGEERSRERDEEGGEEKFMS